MTQVGLGEVDLIIDKTVLGGGGFAACKSLALRRMALSLSGVLPFALMSAGCSITCHMVPITCPSINVLCRAIFS